jgi:hypothetical protein
LYSPGPFSSRREENETAPHCSGIYDLDFFFAAFDPISCKVFGLASQMAKLPVSLETMQVTGDINGFLMLFCKGLIAFGLFFCFRAADTVCYQLFSAHDSWCKLVSNCLHLSASSHKRRIVSHHALSALHFWYLDHSV